MIKSFDTRALAGLTAALSLFICTPMTAAADPGDRPSTAEAFQPNALASKVLNLRVSFNWIEGTDQLWFKRQSPTGDEFIRVDARTGRQSPAFDAAALRRALNTASPGIAAADELSSFGMTLLESGKRLSVETPSATYICNLATMRCDAGQARMGDDLVVSPDGRAAILRRGDNLWLRTLGTGDERQLTHDGERNFGYGDIDRFAIDVGKVQRRRHGAPMPLLGVVWSPDSRFVIALRQDLRSIPERLFLAEYAAPDEAWAPLHEGRFTLARESKTPDSYLTLIDTRTSTARPIALDPQALNDWALQYFTAGVLWWSNEAETLFLITANRGGARYGLQSIDLNTGVAREILHETAPHNVRLNPFDYARPNVFVSATGKEIVWYSERSGYGHLYLYDTARRKVKRALTRGEWVIFDLLRVDEQRRLAYFTAARRGKTGNPYLRHLYRVSLDGGEPTLLTPETADHEFGNGFGMFQARQPAGSRISPSGRYFIDSYSSVDQPPRAVIRKSSGEFVADVLSSDASRLYASGWRPPKRIVAKAADGTTDLHGVVFLPRDFDASKKYPVIDHMYPGPQGRFAPLSFGDALVGGFGKSQLHADAGFIVVVIDGRGTAYRSRAFRDAFLGTEDVFGAGDHVAAISDLAARYPYFDLTRVGVKGDSYGGYGSLRAMLLYPDFFKVGVSGTGPGQWLDFLSGTDVERFFGVPTASSEARAFFDVVSNTRLAPKLRGRVLFIYGGIDENVPLKSAFTLFDALIEADKDFDVLIIPEGTHGAPVEPYALRRSVQYFIDHLRQAAP